MRVKSFFCGALGCLLLAGGLRADDKLDAQLYDAAEAGDLAKIQAALAGGAAINAHVGEPQWTPLIRAVKSNHLEAVKLLVEKGADVEARSKIKQRALQEDLETALLFNKYEVVQLLIERGAKAKAAPISGIGSPLIFNADEGDHADLVRLLLDGGADINAAGYGGNTPLCVSIQKYGKEAPG